MEMSVSTWWWIIAGLLVAAELATATAWVEAEYRKP